MGGVLLKRMKSRQEVEIRKPPFGLNGDPGGQRPGKEQGRDGDPLLIRRDRLQKIAMAKSSNNLEARREGGNKGSGIGKVEEEKPFIQTQSDAGVFNQDEGKKGDQITIRGREGY